MNVNGPTAGNPGFNEVEMKVYNEQELIPSLKDRVERVLESNVLILQMDERSLSSEEFEIRGQVQEDVEPLPLIVVGDASLSSKELREVESAKPAPLVKELVVRRKTSPTEFKMKIFQVEGEELPPLRDRVEDVLESSIYLQRYIKNMKNPMCEIFWNEDSQRLSVRSKYIPGFYLNRLGRAPHQIVKKTANDLAGKMFEDLKDKVSDVDHKTLSDELEHFLKNKERSLLPDIFEYDWRTKEYTRLSKGFQGSATKTSENSWDLSITSPLALNGTLTRIPNGKKEPTFIFEAKNKRNISMKFTIAPDEAHGLIVTENETGNTVRYTRSEISRFLDRDMDRAMDGSMEDFRFNLVPSDSFLHLKCLGKFLERNRQELELGWVTKARFFVQ